MFFKPNVRLADFSKLLLIGFAAAMKRAKARAPESGVHAASAQFVLAVSVQPMLSVQKAIGDPWCHVTAIPCNVNVPLSPHPTFGHPLPIRWGEGRVRGAAVSSLVGVIVKKVLGTPH